VELTKLADLVGVRAFAVGSRHFEHDGQALQLRMCEENPKPFADQPLPDVVVAVAIRSERRLGIVRVKCAEAVEPDAPVEVVEERGPRRRIRYVDAGREEMARVERPIVPPVPAEFSISNHVCSLQRSRTCSTAGTTRARAVSKPAPRWDPT